MRIVTEIPLFDCKEVADLLGRDLPEEGDPKVSEITNNINKLANMTFEYDGMPTLIPPEDIIFIVKQVINSKKRYYENLVQEIEKILQ